MMQRLASRSFTTDDQARFAGLTGDFNPAHMDPVVARRLQAGAPIVHGMHTLLWCLDVLAAHRPDLPAVATFKVRFDKLVYLGDVVEALLMRHDARGFHLEAQVQGAVALRCAATYGEPRAAPASEPHRQSLSRPTQPVDLSIEQMAGGSGRVAFASPSAELGRMFPAAARQWGDHRVASLGCMTYLVGMVCPGLHSIFGGMSLDVVDVAQTVDADTVSFCVGTVDPRFRVVRLKVSANGLVGTLESFARPPPIEQAGIAQLAHLVRPGEFADTHALVIGGSRGLGEVTAKLLAAGGAHVTLTYATGSVDAERIRDDIEAWGAPCRIVQYDIRRPPGGQLEWGHVPNSQLSTSPRRRSFGKVRSFIHEIVLRCSWITTSMRFLYCANI